MTVESTPSPPPATTGAAPPDPGKPGPGGSLPVRLLMRFLSLREGSIIIVTIGTIVYFAATTSNYFTYSNFKTWLPYFCFLAIMAAGQVFVMTLGEIDLSIGALYLFTPFIYWKLTEAGLPLLLALIFALVIAGLIGAVNGFFVAYVGIASFVATLAMLFFLDGLTLIISHSQQINMPGTNTVKITPFARIFGEGTYSELIWAVAIVVLLQIGLALTRWGLYTVATGGNRLGAAEAGIRVRFVLIRNFVVCAMTAGFAGILEGVRTTTITPDPSGSNQSLLYAVAAVIIGGTLMTGGEGTVVGALIGAMFIGVLQDGLAIKSVNADYLFAYLGIAVIIAMTFNVIVRRVRVRSGRA
jgi:simple sugar transport system permease protein